MKKFVSQFFSLLILVGTSVLAQDYPTITVINRADESANVRVVGPTSRGLEVGSGASRTVPVSGGTYCLKVQYCDSNGRCRYSKTGSFTVTQTRESVSEITITLHSSGGNLNERGISEAEFKASF